MELRNIIAPTFTAAALLLSAGCQEQSPAEGLGESLDDAASEVENVVDELSDEVEHATDDVRDSLEDSLDEIEDAAEDLNKQL